MQKIFDKDGYYIAYSDDKEIVHAGEVKEGKQVATAQPNFEEFEDRKKWKDRAEELGYKFQEEKPLV